jgi:hypothetical protein
MTTQEYCRKLLDEVERAGRDPELAYLVRTRLRRAVVALERGRCGGTGGLLAHAPSEVRHRVSSLGARVTSLCQPSEALDVRWKREWGSVLGDVEHLRHWVDCQTSGVE